MTLWRSKKEVTRAFTSSVVLVVLAAVDWKVEQEITQSKARAWVSGRLYSHDLWLTGSSKKPSEHVYYVNTILLSDGLS